ncbi:hypothetical protein TL16_g00991 [Triparma laevis f. inornata]|uniref:Uncharacterized protein n=1 Tax=Triparma laevis f. inornata TaxID=1714386 RepID=A0A9W7DQC2_9STRA|nr:hypothetical protein TL16_g00991 [Triparma laevis f. inornata]
MLTFIPVLFRRSLTTANLSLFASALFCWASSSWRTEAGTGRLMMVSDLQILRIRMWEIFGAGFVLTLNNLRCYVRLHTFATLNPPGAAARGLALALSL